MEEEASRLEGVYSLVETELLEEVQEEVEAVVPVVEEAVLAAASVESI